MRIIEHLNSNHKNIHQLNQEFCSAEPKPYVVIDNFLPIELAKSLEQECETIPSEYWSKFTRHGSYMEECINMLVAPVGDAFVGQMHSQPMMHWLTELTGIEKMIPDPYLVGAAYSRSYRDCSLKIHTDFNWNESIRCYRKLSFIIYLNEDWQEEWGGHLEFKDQNNDKTIARIAPMFNRAVIWQHDELGFHGFPDPLQCPEHKSRNTFRLFFYASNSEIDEKNLPHRSLYWFDKNKNMPYDNRDEK